MFKLYLVGFVSDGPDDYQTVEAWSPREAAKTFAKKSFYERSLDDLGDYWDRDYIIKVTLGNEWWEFFTEVTHSPVFDAYERDKVAYPANLHRGDSFGKVTTVMFHQKYVKTLMWTCECDVYPFNNPWYF